jgi:hypothetical protein
MKVSYSFFSLPCFNQKYSDSTEPTQGDDTITTVNTTVIIEMTTTTGEFISKKSAEEFHFIYFIDSILSSVMTTSSDQANEG